MAKHDNLFERNLPVHVVDTGSPQDDDPRRPQEGIALCLSGGGYRAMLFTDAAMRNWVDRGLPMPASFPYHASEAG